MDIKSNKKILILVSIILISTAVFLLPRVINFIKWLVMPGARVQVVKHFPFSDDASLREWEEKIFKGRVLYSIDRENHQSFVLASSNKTASALYYKIKLDMDKRPVISWRWNAQKFPVKKDSENLKDVKQDDFAARVYVIFPALFFTNSKALEYVWAESTPEETVVPSPYSKNLQLIVAESGRRENGAWIEECRDIYEDYIKAFGSETKLGIGAIAFMTDSDTTESLAESFYDEIKIGYKGGDE